jgi:prepilin-type N-terminal cleavage/methylation domain-containing protein
MKDSNRECGFSLIELLIVVAVILVISALAIPKLLRSKIAANEASAVSSLKAVNTACANYSLTYNIGYPLALAYLGPGTPANSTAADLIDSVVAGGLKSGYNLTYVSGAPSSGQIRTYTLNATPSVPNITGQRYFFTDQTGVLRQNFGAVATSASAQIQ